MSDLCNSEAVRPEREAVREAFDDLTRTLRNLDDLSQMVVGNTINMANRAFLQAHENAAAFMRLPRHEQAAYSRTLTATVDELRQGDPETALGFGLFRMWIDALISGDEDLIRSFSYELLYFGEKGDLTRYFQ